MAGIGHNSGRVIEPGLTWRTHAWGRARKALLPTLPLEVVRLRVRRAAELGLPYKTYAGIRASTGHDLIGFMFSSNALQVLRAGQPVPQARGAKLDGLRDCLTAGIVHAPVRLADVTPPLHRADPAPRFAGSWSDMRDHLRGIVRDIGRPADRFVLVGETAWERDWSEAMQTAGFLSGADFFALAAPFP